MVVQHDDDLVPVLRSALANCRFDLDGQLVHAHEARKLYEQYVQGLLKRYRPRPIIDEDDHAFRTFTDALSVTLKEHVNEGGCVGNGLAELMGGEPHLTIEQFATNMLRGSASLGVETTVGILSEWMKGTPIRYQVRYALANRSKGDPSTVNVISGIQLSTLPQRADHLLSTYPALRGADRLDNLTGKVLLTVEMEADRSGIYRPEENGHTRQGVHSVVPDFDVSRFCNALSLVENESVVWQFAWEDFGDLQELNSGMHGSRLYRVSDLTGAFSEGIATSKAGLGAAIKVYSQLKGATGPRLHTAISRWKRSKQFINLSHRFIELRIALESLYAGDAHGEAAFRVAAHGALHLGQDYEECRRRRKLLKKVYDRASRAVHGDNLDPTSERDQYILACGSDTCRAGILKCLEEGRDLDLDKLMFDRF